MTKTIHSPISVEEKNHWLGKLALAALVALKLAQWDGKAARNTQSENLFLLRWLQTALKQKRFHRCVVHDFEWLIRLGQQRLMTSKTCCQAKLNRVSLMLDGVAINKEDISHLSQQLNDEEWHTLQTTRLKVLCRFCCELHTPPLPVFFDLVGFQRYLLVDLSMKPSTVREYLTRLRRIDTLLVTLNIDMPRLNVTQIKGILAEHYLKQSFNNAGPALNQYADYVTECLANDIVGKKYVLT